MKLISTTITNARADVIGPALAAVAPHVAEVHLIDTGADIETLRIARAVVPEEKFRLHQWKWRDSFAAARNAALDVARTAGADWALSADTDETLRLGADPAETRAAVAAANAAGACVIQIPHSSGMFGHDRLVRLAGLPRPEWREPVHEYLVAGPRVAAPAGWCFRTVDRPDEDLVAKYQYYARILEARTRAAPRVPRPWYYLGDTYSILELYESALRAWGRRLRLGGSVYEAAWAGYRAALLCRQLGRDPEPWIARGLAHVPDGHYAELHWLRAQCALEQGRNPRAAAERALACPRPPARHGCFAYPPAWEQLPKQILSL